MDSRVIQSPKDRMRFALTGVAGYVLFGVLWILGSDHWLNTVQLGEQAKQAAAMLKGLSFVVISAGWGLAML